MARSDAAHVETNAYRKRLEIGVVISLFLIVIMFELAPKRWISKSIPTIITDLSLESVEMPPLTRQFRRTPPPLLPQMPLPTEDEFLPDEVTIDDSYLEFAYLELPEPPEGYPEEAHRILLPGKKEKHKVEERTTKDIVLALLVDQYGAVDSLYVISNPTGNDDILADAIRTAYRTRFYEDKAKKEKQHWIQRKF